MRRAAEVPYPPVFRNWHPDIDARITTGVGAAGPYVDYGSPSPTGFLWRRVELTERDACLLAASLLQRAGEDKLAKKVLKELGPNPENASGRGREVQ